MTEPTESTAFPRRQLSLFDVVCIIVGIIIGSGIYRSTPFIAQNVDGPWWLLFAWGFGGLIALIGALCYAELTTAYPAAGGDYVFLSKAYGREMGFLFTWTEFWIVRPGNVGAVAYVFAEYARQLLPLGTRYELAIYAGGAIALVTILNVLGVQVGKWTQNLLTGFKVAGLVAIFVVAFFLVGQPGEAATTARSGTPDFRLAIVLILFAYGGWKDICYVAAEVRHPEKNLLRGLLLGTAAVMVIYLLVNLAFMRGLGFQGFRDSEAVAADLLKIPFGDYGSRAISLLICVSCLGAMNGMIFTGARVYYAMGAEHRFYAWLGKWNEQFGAPVRSLLLQGAVTLALVGAFAADPASFERLVVLTGPFFWTFMVLVGVSIFVLRAQASEKVRTYRVLLYPLTPILFCLTSSYMAYSSFTYLLSRSKTDAFLGICVVAIGAAISFFSPPESAPVGKQMAKPGKLGKTKGR